MPLGLHLPTGWGFLHFEIFYGVVQYQYLSVFFFQVFNRNFCLSKANISNMHSPRHPAAAIRSARALATALAFSRQRSPVGQATRARPSVKDRENESYTWQRGRGKQMKDMFQSSTCRILYNVVKTMSETIPQSSP